MAGTDPVLPLPIRPRPPRLAALLRLAPGSGDAGVLRACASAGLRAEPAALPSPLPTFTVLNFAAHAELADSRSTRCFLLLSRAAPSRP